MNQKGIAALVAIILLIILVLVIGGIGWIVTKGFTSMKEVEERIVKRGRGQIKIESISDGKIYIRNNGEIKLTDLTLYIDGKIVNAKIPSSIDIDKKKTIYLRENIEEEYHQVKITTSEGAGDEIYQEFNFTLAPPGPPIYLNDGDDSGGSVSEGTIVNIWTEWRDNKELDTGYMKVTKSGGGLGGFGGGSTVYEYYSNLEGSIDWFNKSIGTAGDAGKQICWHQEANDTEGNRNETMKNNKHCFTVS